MDDIQNDFYLEVGKLIRAERDVQGLTQEDLATRASLTRNMIANIETGRQQILLFTFISIANGLRISPNELLPKSNIDKTIVKERLSKSKEAKNFYTDFFDDSKKG